MDLLEFIKARLDEDEAAARAVAGQGANWHLSDPDRSSAVVSDRDSIDQVVVYDEGAPTIEQATHIARHDPARVLREVEAKRAVIERYKRAAAIPESVSSFVRGQDDGYRQACLDAIGDAAAVYSDHPDYDPAWATEPGAVS